MTRGRIAMVAGMILSLLGWIPAYAARPAPQPKTTEEETMPRVHEEALTVTTEDEVLKEQLLKVDGVLTELHQRIAQRRLELRGATDEARKAALYSELDGLRKEWNMLERLLHDLVEEAQATQWTAIDEALRRAKSFERYQERTYQREENIRERKQ